MCVFTTTSWAGLNRKKKKVLKCPLLAPLALEDKAFPHKSCRRLWEPAASSSRSSTTTFPRFLFLFFWGLAPFPREPLPFFVFFCREITEREREIRAGGWRRPSSRATGGRACRGREGAG